MTDNNGTPGESSACGCGGGGCCSGSGKWIWIVLILAVAGILVAKNIGKQEVLPSVPVTPAVSETPAAVEAVDSPSTTVPPVQDQAVLPRLVDLGASKCISCKMMKPILGDLKANYAEFFRTEFIDVWEDPEAAAEYEINLIPTQIFFDAEGKELFRHEGFFDKEDILAKWQEFGLDLTAKTQ